MNETLNKLSDKLFRWGKNSILWLCIIIFSIFTGLCTLYTVYFVDGYTEIPYYKIKALPVLLFLLLFIVILWFTKKWSLFDRIKTKKLISILMIYTFAFGSIWVMISHSFPVADREHVSTAATQFILGDWQAFERGNYLFIYPYQLGYTFFLELCYRFAGKGYYMFPQMLNALAVCIIFYSLYKCSRLLFEDQKIADLTLLLSFGGICAMFFTTYVYGNIIGLCCSVLGIWCLLAFLKTEKYYLGIASAVWIAIGCILKSNYLIFMSAMVIILLLTFIKKKKAAFLLTAAMLLLIRPLLTGGLECYFESRTGIPVNDGQPTISSIAMGLQEDSAAPGWHNGFDINSYRNADFDIDAASEAAKTSIHESLQHFIKDPSYTAYFFFTKTVTQWCEPTFQSLWDSNCSNNHTMELSSVAQSIYVGKLYQFFITVMDVFQSLIWGLALFFLIRKRKDISAEQLLFGLIILGGMLFQLIWEAKAQYNIQYLLILIPYAAAGMQEVLNILPQTIKTKSR